MLDWLQRQQRDWAESQLLAVDRAGYFARAEDNLPWLSPEIRSDFDAADGGEFGRAGVRAKIAALHSSSALAVNFFGYWRMRDPKPLAEAVGFDADIAEIRFEQKFPTGVGPRAPNIDVVIRGVDERLLAVESKFCESFTRKSQSLQDKYFPKGSGRWHAAGLPGAQEAADSLRESNAYVYVDAAQLLKHMLGLAQTRTDWRLMLLWYVPTADAAEAMNAEASGFQQLLGPDGARFSWSSYQELWSRLYPLLASQDQEYTAYLGRRYFAGLV
jgi:hypothetical protein